MQKKGKKILMYYRVTAIKIQIININLSKNYDIILSEE